MVGMEGLNHSRQTDIRIKDMISVCYDKNPNQYEFLNQFLAFLKNFVSSILQNLGQAKPAAIPFHLILKAHSSAVILLVIRVIKTRSLRQLVPYSH